MKKKGVNIIAILTIVLLVVIIGVTLFFVLRKTNNDTNTPSSGGMGTIDLGEAVLKLCTIEQFREFAETGDYECYIGEDQSGGSIYDVALLGEEMIVTYYFDQQGATTDFQAFHYLNVDISDKANMVVEEMSIEEMATAAYDIIEKFCLMFGHNVATDLYLTNNDGTFTLIENDANFQSVADGYSFLKFSIRDKEGYFWELRISATEGAVSANISKYFNREETMSYVANISLYEEE